MPRIYNSLRRIITSAAAARFALSLSFSEFVSPQNQPQSVCRRAVRCFATESDQVSICPHSPFLPHSVPIRCLFLPSPTPRRHLCQTPRSLKRRRWRRGRRYEIWLAAVKPRVRCFCEEEFLRLHAGNHPIYLIDKMHIVCCGKRCQHKTYLRQTNVSAAGV